MTNILRIAWRNFWRNLGRYRLLMSALAAAVMVQVTIMGSILGLTDTLRAKAARYFGGQVVVLGYGAESYSCIRDAAQVEQALRSAAARGAALVKRSHYYERDGTLFFAGNFHGQRRLIGVDWQGEQAQLQTLDLVAGKLPSTGDEAAILVSSVAAGALGVRVGDELIVSGTTETGQRNTAFLVVAGIFNDPSIFGYTSYLPFRVVNRLLGVEPDRVSEIGLFLPPRADPDRQARRVLAALAERLPVYPLFATQAERDRALHKRHPETTRYGVITLDANLAEIRSLLDSLTILAGFLILLFLLIVVIGVANTYSMIVYERTQEIGTMRALGMPRRHAAWMFLFEALLLSACGTALGFGGGILALSGLSLLDLSAHEGLLMFLSRGRLAWSLSPGWTIGIIAAMAAASLAGCLRSARRAAAVAPIVALRKE